MIKQSVMGVPSGGLNLSDTPRNITDLQATSLKNLRVVGNALESYRGLKRIYSSVQSFTGSTAVTDDLLMFRPKEGNVEMLFAAEGKVYKCSSPNSVAEDIGYSGDVKAKIKLIQYQNKVYIFNGVDANKKYTGSNLWGMGIDAPTEVPTLSGSGSLTRNYSYTYYNSIDGTESNPCPTVNITTAQAENTSVGVTASTDPQVDKIRIYRDGEGILTQRLCKTVANATATITDDSTDAEVAQAEAVRYDRDKPPVLGGAIVHANRLWGYNSPGDPDTIFVSNEGEPEYMPEIPFLEKELAYTGGSIEIRAGDGQNLQATAPWGDMVIAFKEQNAYRIQESDVGFYSYQPMPIVGCIAPGSVQMITEGLVWLSPRGFMLLDYKENQVAIGEPVKALTDRITHPELVESAVVAGNYVVTFEITGVGRKSLTYIPGSGWQGIHDIPLTALFVDIDGKLYGGRTSEAGVSQCYLDVTGIQAVEPQKDLVDIEWSGKADDYGMPGYYKRFRFVRISGRYLSKTGKLANMEFVVDDGNGTVLYKHKFVLPENGIIMLGIVPNVHGDNLRWTIRGRVNRPIQINHVEVHVEYGADIHD